MLRSPHERFWAKTKPGPCIEWNGAKNRHGYGYFRRGTKIWLSHRAVYEMIYGKIPAGMNVCHSCDNPSCIRPDHLFLGTQEDNIRDMEKKGRDAFRRAREKTHCLRGHAYRLENTTRDQDGHRACKICRVWRDKQRYKRLKAVANDRAS